MSDLMELKDQIKNSVTMRDVIDRLDLGPIRAGKIRSIYKTEKTPSLHVYKYDYFDYATGQGGDVIRFTMDAMSWSFVTAVRWLSRGGDELAPRRKEPEKKVQDFTRLFGAIDVGPQPVNYTVAEAYVKEKWPTLSIHDILRFGSKLSTAGDIWTPHYDNSRVVGIKIRGISPRFKKSVTGSTFRLHLYRVADAARPVGSREAWIVEGESDCWALTKYFEQRGPRTDVFALPSGAGLWRDEWRKELSGYEHVTVCMDRDEAGVAAAERIEGSLSTVGIDVSVLRMLKWKDAAEALAGGWAPLALTRRP